MPSPAKTPYRILCVDDRVESLEVRRVFLTRLGYEVLIAGDPVSALAIIDKVNVDLVVVDYSFPGQMSGEELAHQLRTRKPTLPLIMLSGYPDLPDTVKESVDVLILKGAGPPSDLLNSIASLLGLSEGSTSGAGETNQKFLERSKALEDPAKSRPASRDKS